MQYNHTVDNFASAKFCRGIINNYGMLINFTFYIITVKPLMDFKILVLYIVVLPLSVYSSVTSCKWMLHYAKKQVLQIIIIVMIINLSSSECFAAVSVHYRSGYRVSRDLQQLRKCWSKRQYYYCTAIHAIMAHNIHNIY